MRKIRDYIKAVISNFRPDSYQMVLIDRLRSENRKFGSKRKAEIWIEYYPYPEALNTFSECSKILAEKYGARIRGVTLSRWPKFLFLLNDRTTTLIYRLLGCTDFLFVEHQKVDPGSVTNLVAELFPKIASKRDLLNLEVLGYKIGTDIYEAFLREKNQPTLDIKSAEFKQFFVGCVRNILFFRDYFQNNDVKALLLSHGVYRLGILGRVAAAHGVVVLVTTTRSILRVHNTDFPRCIDFGLYPKLFSKLSLEQKVSAKDKAKELLDRRIVKADVGVVMPYSTKSAFSRFEKSEVRVLDPSDKLKVLIAPSCFFDLPHCYGGSLFDDFYEWVCFLGQLTEKTDYDWYVKTHPDSMAENEPVWRDLLLRFPKFRMIPKETSFHQLADEGIRHVLSVYGSVGHELPLLGMTVINSGYNPHIGYNFNITPSTVAEYENVLLNLKNVSLEVDRDEIYEFFYIHHFTTQLNIDLTFLDYFKEVEKAKELKNENYYFQSFVEQMTVERQERYKRRLLWFLEHSKSDWYQELEYREWQSQKENLSPPL